MNARADTDTHAIAERGASLEVVCSCGRSVMMSPEALLAAPARDVLASTFK